MTHLEVVNWREFQHYRNRGPLWIKLYRKLLRKHEWYCLQDASKGHLVGIWLLASDHDNRIPNDAEWIGKEIGAKGPVDLQELITHGFLNLVQSDSELLAGCQRNACLETETETETTKAAKRENGRPTHISEVLPLVLPKRGG